MSCLVDLTPQRLPLFRGQATLTFRAGRRVSAVDRILGIFRARITWVSIDMTALSRRLRTRVGTSIVLRVYARSSSA